MFANPFARKGHKMLCLAWIDSISGDTRSSTWSTRTNINAWRGGNAFANLMRQRHPVVVLCECDHEEEAQDIAESVQFTQVKFYMENKYTKATEVPR